MLLLSSLLGPAKPPVASRDDVASALGVHRVQRSAEAFVAMALDGTSQIPIASGERCLVCLCEYEPDEQLRQLTKCTHLFHRECIDEVRFVQFFSSVTKRLQRVSVVVDHRTQLLSALQRPRRGRETGD